MGGIENDELYFIGTLEDAPGEVGYPILKWYHRVGLYFNKIRTEMICDWFLAGLDDNLYLSANEPFPVLMMIFQELRFQEIISGIN